MKKEEIYNYIKENLKISGVKMDEPMSNHTSFKIGGNADIFVTANSIEEIKAVIKYARENKINIYVIGNGSNLLVKDNGIRGIVLKINLKNVEIKNNDSSDKVIVDVESGVQLGFLANILLKNNISGFEFAVGIPGTVGGAVRMNAGAYGGEFKDIVVNTKCIDYDGNEITLTNEEQKFEYRKSIFCNKDLIIIQTSLELTKVDSSEQIEKIMKENMESRKEKQPINYPSAGSTFKRGEDFITAKVIDEVGLKGYKIGGAMVSEKHAGFIVNYDNASAKDILDLIEYVKKRVKEEKNKDLQLEVLIIGD